MKHIRKAAVAAALASGKVLMKHYGKSLDIREKKGEGLVTNVDVAAEEAALKILRKTFPDFGILTEESAGQESRGEGRWILDPLDGTTNYIHSFPMFCVSIAAEWRNQIVVGVIFHPVLKDTYVAVRGQGATVNGKPIRVSETPRLKDALLTTGFAYMKGPRLQQEISAFGRLSETARAIRRPGSAALDLAYTARGVFDGFWERNLSAWDVAAGSLLVEEAGGKVSDFKGNPFDPYCREILATNRALHSQIRQTLSPEYCEI